MGKRMFKLVFELDPAIDQAFMRLYHTKDFDQFRGPALDFLDRVRGNPTAQDQFFSNFTPIMVEYLGGELWHRAGDMWRQALDLAREWEGRHASEVVHKGTLFYFWGMNVIQKRELDFGYLLMHQALEEDIRTQGSTTPPTPAFAFAILDYEKVDQAFRDWPLQLADFLDELLSQYRASRYRSLTLEEFREKFLINPPSRDIVFLFGYTVGRFYLLNTAVKYALRSAFAAQLQLNLLFDITLVIDAIIEAHNPSQWQFSQHAAFLSRQARLGLSQHQLQSEVNQAFNNDFAGTLGDLLDGGFTLSDGSCPSATGADLAIVYGLRNRGAHHLSSVQAVAEHFLEIRQRLFNVLFLAVETLH